MRGERTPFPPPVAITNKVRMTQQEVCACSDGGEESGRVRQGKLATGVRGVQSVSFESSRVAPPLSRSAVLDQSGAPSRGSDLEK